jgi:hypothetical protein
MRLDAGNKRKEKTNARIRTYKYETAETLSEHTAGEFGETKSRHAVKRDG